jgi:hypothetical protein
MRTIVVSGALANKPRNGGEAWVRLNWVLGLKRLGFATYFVEQIGRENCLDENGAVTTFEDSINLAHFRKVTGQFGLTGSSALIYQNGEQIHGATEAELTDLAAAADLLVNISGHLTFRPLMRQLRRKAYVDIDPGFTQFWHEAGQAGARLDDHDFYFTIAENIGRPGCGIPTGNINWRPTRQPVVLDEWPVSSTSACARFTTVASWRGPYGPVQHGATTFGLKVHEFRRFIELPQQGDQTFEIALDIHPADGRDLDLLRRHGWVTVDPKVVAPDPPGFRQYVQTSDAEFSVAQGIYVATDSGWFSDRTIRYLASGKPALVQDTGFSRNYPVGEGLVAFRTLEQAVVGAQRIVREYEAHCQAARALAERYFDSDTVLSRFVDEIECRPGRVA